VRWFAQPGLDTSLWRVAWAADEVAGSVMTMVWHDENAELGIRRAWLEHVSVRRPWRRQGLASALIVATLRMLKAGGYDEAMLGVHGENPTGALGLYEKVGFRVHRRWAMWRKPMGPARGALTMGGRRRVTLLILAVTVLCAAAGCGAGTGASQPASSPTEGTPMSFTLTSSAFDHGEPIPREYTCQGADDSPPLAWVGAPSGTAAFALIVDDVDASGFVHWLAYDLPGDSSGLRARASGSLTGREGANSFGQVGWGGPCPPSGTHHYVFRLLALSAPTGLPRGADAAAVRRAVKDTTLAEVTLTGTYRKG
jgi:Raf kinase inhibitor-like YbhB/YbcL family protein